MFNLPFYSDKSRSVFGLFFFFFFFCIGTFYLKRKRICLCNVKICIWIIDLHMKGMYCKTLNRDAGGEGVFPLCSACEFDVK